MRIRFCIPPLFCLILTTVSALPQAAGAAGTTAAGTTAVRAADFLNSLGANSAISRRGESLPKTIDCARYLGLRWFRAGNEGDIPMQDLIALHQQAGVRYS